MHPARRLWTALEPIHGVVYFAPGVRDAGVEIGLRGYWMTYFAFRAAPLGPVGPGVVVAAFAGFEPSMVFKALPDAWSRAEPAACLAARSAVSTAALRMAGVDEAALADVVSSLAPVAASMDPTGRALYAANAELPLPDDPVAAVWQLATTLREHRGDGHVAALLAAGVTGLEALVLQVGAGRFPAELMRSVRGWPVAEWDAAARALRGRGMLAEDGTLTAWGAEFLDAIEERTDERAWTGGLAGLGEDAVERVLAALRPSVDSLWRSGMLPEVNPTGLPATRV
ncbi:SCO6745 family protein [Actinophytocola sp.]|uniref:SCO6745 family protein n=1 Tax=Actinophytocola sp. TaxID=1872138 RepID=UPI003D6B49CD